MPVTALDPKTALVVIDLQRGITGLPCAHPMEPVIANSVRLAEAFRSKGLPVVLVNVAFAADFADALKPRVQMQQAARSLPPDFSLLIDDLRADPQRDVLITKRNWGAFYGTGLDLQLRRRGITGVVLCGVATSIGVESTARDAYERNYNLTFASDAMTDMVLSAHQNSMEVIFPRMGEIGTTDEILGFVR